MKLLLDSANLEEIKSVVNNGAIYGVTTNPSLVAKEAKGPYMERIKSFIRVLADSPTVKHLSVEAISTDPSEIYEQSLKINTLVRNIDSVDLHVKVPVTMENLTVISSLRDKGVKVNATACMTGMQAAMASEAGAEIVSFFYNRIKDGGGDPFNEIADYKHFCRPVRRYSFGQEITIDPAQIICGSIRNTNDIAQCFRAEVEYVTASAKLLRELTVHPQTDKAIAQFQKDIDAWLS